MRSKTVFTMLAALLVLACLSCSTSNVGPLTDPARDASRFTLTVDPQSFIDGSSAEEIYLTTEESDPYHVLVSVNARGAVGMKALYFSMNYDADALRPMTVEPSDAMGPRGDMLRIQIKKDRGTLHYGQIVTNPLWRTGASGDVTLATVSFRKETTPAWRVVSAAADSADSAAHLTFTAPDQLDWLFANLGDYNQNGIVEVADLTPLGVHFGEDSPSGAGTPWPYEDSLSVVDGNHNGLIEVADITPIGQQFGKNINGGYNVYASADQSDYPTEATGGNGGATMLGNVAFNTAAGDKNAVRLTFTYAVGSPVADDWYWVRPVDSVSTNEGIASTLAGGPEGEKPVLALTNPPASGSGTSGDPYVANVTTDYIFTLTDPVDGDVSNDAGTVYSVSNGAGTIDTADATLNIEDAFTGNFNVTATYNGTPNRSDTTVFMTVGAGPSGDLFIMPDDMGSPPWSDVPSGDGETTETAYVVRSDAFNSDYSATFGLAANTESDGSGDNIDVTTLTWDAFPPFIVQDPSWATPGEFMAVDTGFTNGHVFAEDGDSNMSNDLFIVSVNVLP
jgi:hypothetical protein